MAEELIDPRFDEDDIAEVLGVSGGDVETAARASERLFIRDEMHVARYAGRGRGKVLTAFEAWSAVGWPTLARLTERTSSGFVRSGCEVDGVLRRGREILGLSQGNVADAAGTSIDFVRSAEGGRLTMPVRGVLSMARALGLEDWRLGTFDATQISALFALPRSFTDRSSEASPTRDGLVATSRTVLDLTRATWILSTRQRLRQWLSEGSRFRDAAAALGSDLPPGKAGNDPYQVGASNALLIRRRAGLGEGPVLSVTRLAEDLFGIPVVHMPLERRLSGAVVKRGSTKGIVVNVEGFNTNPGVMRVTLAHEICHMLLDASALRPLEVGALVDELSPDAPLERRAQAFASELLLPKDVAARAFRQERDPVARLVETYGVSRTLVERQAWLGKADVPRPAGPRPLLEPSERWLSAESPGRTAFGRNLVAPWDGVLAEICEKAFDRNLISLDTCAEILGISVPDYVAAEQLLHAAAPK